MAVLSDSGLGGMGGLNARSSACEKPHAESRRPLRRLRGLSAETKKKSLGEREYRLLLPKKGADGSDPRGTALLGLGAVPFSLPGFNDSQCHLSEGAEQA